MPALAPIIMRALPTSYRSASFSSSFSARAQTSVSVARQRTTARNSSPPTRASSASVTRPASFSARKKALRRAATMRRRLSPALWPKVSLMPLKRLRSMNRKTPSSSRPSPPSRAVDPDLLAVRKPGDRVVEGELADAPEARAQVRQHRLEGDAEAVDLAEAGRPERHLEIALGDGGRRPRQLRQAAG